PRDWSPVRAIHLVSGKDSLCRVFCAAFPPYIFKHRKVAGGREGCVRMLASKSCEELCKCAGAIHRFADHTARDSIATSRQDPDQAAFFLRLGIRGDFAGYPGGRWAAFSPA